MRFCSIVVGVLSLGLLMSGPVVAQQATQPPFIPAMAPPKPVPPGAVGAPQSAPPTKPVKTVATTGNAAMVVPGTSSESATPPAQPVAAAPPMKPVATAPPTQPALTKSAMPYLYGKDRQVPLSGEALPGLGPMPGAEQPIEPVTVSVRDGVNYAVNVSDSMANRIATPFARPEVVDASGANIITTKNNVFVVPASSEPFALYIYDGSSASSPVISLTMVPKHIPQQSIIVQFSSGAVATGGKNDEKRSDDATATSYTDWLRKTLRQVVRGVAPPGFNVGKLAKRVAHSGSLRILPETRYSSQNCDVYQYQLTNEGGAQLELNEASFYQNGVKAVAFYPDIVLAPGQTTNVYILAAHQHSERPSDD